MKKTLVSMAAAAALLATGSAAGAQICAGHPAVAGGFYFGGRADFPEGLNSVGVEANYNVMGPLGIFAGLDIVSQEDVPDSDENVFNVGAAFEVASLGAMIGPQVSVCPQASYIFSDGEGSGYAIPIGLGFGANLGVPGIGLQGYAIPQLIISEFADETSTDFGARAGALISLGMITLGAELQHVFVDEADPVFGIRAGLRIP